MACRVARSNSVRQTVRVDAADGPLPPPLPRDDTLGEAMEQPVGGKAGGARGQQFERGRHLELLGSLRRLDDRADPPVRAVVEGREHAEPAPLPRRQPAGAGEADLREPRRQ